MPKLILPFEPKPLTQRVEQLFKGELYQKLPKPVQEACQKRPHLLEYLNMIPLEHMELPTWYEKPDRKLADAKERNIMYPAGQDIIIHVFSKLGEERDFYIAIEPAFGASLATANQDPKAQSKTSAQIYEKLRLVEEPSWITRRRSPRRRPRKSGRRPSSRRWRRSARSPLARGRTRPRHLGPWAGAARTALR
jgi:hypothetical protein